MNTQLSYQYRDANNYKAVHDVVIQGTLLFSDIQPCLEEGQYFIPQAVGLPPLQLDLAQYSAGRLTAADHVWHELTEGDLVPTDAPPNCAISAADLKGAFARFHDAEWPIARFSQELGIP